MSVRIVVMTVLIAVVAAPAVAATGTGSAAHDRGRLYRDCAAGERLSGGYSLSTLRSGLIYLPDGLGLYTGCPGAIRRQIAARTGHGSPVAVDVAQVYRECGSEGALHPGHTLAGLRKALRGMPTDLAEYSPCVDLVKDALKQRTHSRPASGVKRIYGECGHTGRVRHRYSLATLRKARKRLPGDLALYTTCRPAIRDAIERAIGV